PCHTSPSRRRFASLNTDYWDHYSPSRSRSPVIGKPTSGDHLTKDQAVETPGPWLIDLGVEQEEDQYDHDMTQENGEGSSASASIKWATDGPWIDPGDWPPVSAEDAGMVDGQFGNDLASVAAPAESNDEAAGAGVLAALQDWQASPAAIRWALQEYIPVTALPSTNGAVPRDEWVWVAGGVVQARYLEFQENAAIASPSNGKWTAQRVINMLSHLARFAIGGTNKDRKAIYDSISNILARHAVARPVPVPGVEQ
ncbi:hypothetical protein BCR44DRAFT_1438018, partial [Catenaria anguillulae PL171]